MVTNMINEAILNEKQWRCFFCDETFTNKEKAAEHFGIALCEVDVPACKLFESQELILKYIRECENEIRQYQDGNKPLQRAIWAVQSEKDKAVKEAEEKGYAKGVADMQKQGYCVEPTKHD